MICFLLGHKFGRAFSRGHRDRRTGRWIKTGLDYKTCCRCGAERESLIQFGVERSGPVGGWLTKEREA